MTMLAPVASPTGSRSFADLGVPSVLVEILAAQGITSPLPIQSATLPDALAGRDVIGRGRTGSGKTLAFVIPTVAAIALRGAEHLPGRPRALVLVPTRELASQVAATAEPLARALGLRVAVIHGGVSAGPQVKALSRGVDIVIACPGRLEDLISQRKCRLDRVAVTVLDEADHMADLGFLPAVKRLLAATPSAGQRLLFSATMDNAVDVLVRTFLTDPVMHAVDPASAPVPEMTHHILHTSSAEKAAVVRRLAAGPGRRVMFMRTKHGAKKLTQQLSRSGIPSVELHGNLSQAARERNLDQFTRGNIRVLVATDIAARGIHVDEVALVVHVDPPAEHKSYLHRSGRTARAGASGIVVTIATADQRRDVASLTKKAGITPTATEVTALHPLLNELTGTPPDFVMPVAPPMSASEVAADARRDTRPAGAPRRGARPAQRSSGQPAAGRGGPRRGGQTGQSRSSSGQGAGNGQGQSSGRGRRSRNG
jgi:superfamily II DNA/RNA helicase